MLSKKSPCKKSQKRSPKTRRCLKVRRSPKKRSRRSPKKRSRRSPKKRSRRSYKKTAKMSAERSAQNLSKKSKTHMTERTKKLLKLGVKLRPERLDYENQKLKQYPQKR
jgi:hypothetical protein